MQRKQKTGCCRNLEIRPVQAVLPREHLRASCGWILRLYRQFCQFIYGPGSIFYDTVSQLISLGQWNRWRKLALDHLPQGRVLELGFGTGWLQMELAKSGRVTYGLEYSADMVKQCQKMSCREAFLSHRVRGDGQCLPFANAVFQGIVATFPEQYIATEACLRECRRVMASQPDAKMVIVGRWLELEIPLLKKLFPVFYRPLNLAEVEEFKKRASQCHLQMELLPVKCGYVRHYIILLTAL